MRIYISGPITGHKGYMARFNEAEQILIDEGYASIINPAWVNAQLPNDFSHEDYMRVCVAELECCDTIYMLNGWRDSKGANIEYAYAKSHGYNIMYESEVE